MLREMMDTLTLRHQASGISKNHNRRLNLALYSAIAIPVMAINQLVDRFKLLRRQPVLAIPSKGNT
jgi:hypothetical protein